MRPETSTNDNSTNCECMLRRSKTIISSIASSTNPLLNNNNCEINVHKRTFDSLARDLFRVWKTRVGSSIYISRNKIDLLLKDLHLSPSSRQVSQMIQSARAPPRRAISCNGSPVVPRQYQKFLTFGEFCVLIEQFSRSGSTAATTASGTFKHRLKKVRSHSSFTCNGCVCNGPKVDETDGVDTKYDVFLGGSCNPTTWRTDVAIPTLEQYNISYYNPQVATWSPDLLISERRAKATARMLLYVLDTQTRGLASIVEIAQLYAQNRQLCVVRHQLARRQKILNEIITDQEFMDLHHAQTLLLRVIAHGKNATRVFDTLPDALKHVRDTASVKNGAGHHARTQIVSRALRRSISCTTDLKTEPACHCASTHVNVKKRYDVYVNASRDILQNVTVAHCTSTIRDPSVTVLNDRIDDACSNRIDGLDLDGEMTLLTESKVLLFVITRDTRALSAMVLASYACGLKARVTDLEIVLCVQNLEEGCVINGEKLSNVAVKDYNRCRAYLIDMAKYSAVPVFDNVEHAINHAIKRVKEV